MLTTVDVTEVYSRCSAGFAARVRAVDGRWGLPTGLPGWTVADLVRHVVVEECWAPPLLAGATADEVGTRFDGDLLGADPVAAHAGAADGALAAVRADGALERTVHLSFGDHPGHEFVMQLAADHLVHTWDLARAIGADPTLDPAAVDVVGDWFDGTEALYREAGVIGPPVPVPATANAQARLLGRFGRQP